MGSSEPSLSRPVHPMATRCCWAPWPMRSIRACTPSCPTMRRVLLRRCHCLRARSTLVLVGAAFPIKSMRTWVRSAWEGEARRAYLWHLRHRSMGAIVAGELLKHMTKVNVAAAVPYKARSAVANDLIEGHRGDVPAVTTSATPLVEAGKPPIAIRRRSARQHNRLPQPSPKPAFPARWRKPGTGFPQHHQDDRPPEQVSRKALRCGAVERLSVNEGQRGGGGRAGHQPLFTPCRAGALARGD